MYERSDIERLADELEALASGEGVAYGIYHDENMVEVVADQDGMVQIAAAFARTAALSEAEPYKARSGPEVISAFKADSGLYLWWPTFSPAPDLPSAPELDLRSRIEIASIKVGCLLFVLLALVGLVSIILWLV